MVVVLPSVHTQYQDDMWFAAQREGFIGPLGRDEHLSHALLQEIANRVAIRVATLGSNALE